MATAFERDQWPVREAQLCAVAAELQKIPAQADRWHVENVSHEPDQYQYLQLVRADDLRLQFEWDSYQREGRIGIRLVWPKNDKGESYVIRTPPGQADPTTGITVDAKRSADTIARELLRRLVLKDAERLHLQAVERIKDQASVAAGQLAVVARLLATSPGAHTNERNCGPFTIFAGAASYCYQLRVDSPDSIRFEAFSCPVEVAIKILEASGSRPTAAEDDSD